MCGNSELRDFVSTESNWNASGFFSNGHHEYNCIFTAGSHLNEWPSRHQAARGNPKWLGMALVDAGRTGRHCGVLPGLALLAEAKVASFRRAAGSGARSRETKTGGSTGPYLAAETICNSGFRHHAQLPGGAIRFPRAGTHDGGIFARTSGHGSIDSGTEGKTGRVSGAAATW